MHLRVDVAIFMNLKKHFQASFQEASVMACLNGSLAWRFNSRAHGKQHGAGYCQAREELGERRLRLCKLSSAPVPHIMAACRFSAQDSTSYRCQGQARSRPSLAGHEVAVEQVEAHSTSSNCV